MESDHEDGPNFSYAYGENSGNSSWNPALRPDNARDSSPAPAKKPVQPSPDAVQAPEPFQTTQDREESEEAPLPKESEASPHVNTDVFDGAATADDDFFDRPHTLSGGPQSIPEPPSSEGDDTRNGDDMLEPPSESEEKEESGVANSVAENTHEGRSGAEEVQQDATEIHLPAENYEHQGESTLLEDAMTRNGDASLLSEPTPITDDWGASGEAFDLGGRAEDAPIPAGQVESVIATAGNQNTQDITTEGAVSQDIDWGTTDDQDLFPVDQPQDTEGQTTAAMDHEPSEKQIQPSQGAEALVDSMWNLALDDDFLPDTDEGAAPFSLDDDEGFLDDEPTQPVPGTVQITQAGSSMANKYARQVIQTQASKPAQDGHGVQTPQFTDFSHMDQKKPMATPNVAYGAYNQPVPYQQPGRPAMASSAQSFVDKSKGGYHSPFDLPEDIVATRKRPVVHHHATAPIQPIVPAPPRSGGIYTALGQSAPRPPPVSSISVSNLTPPSSSHSMKSPLSGMPPADLQKPASLSKQSSTDFFAELPVTSKPKPPPSGRYTPQSTVPAPPAANFAPPHFQQKERTSSWSSLRNEVLPDTTSLVSQLQQPERLPAFPDQFSPPARSNSLPVPQPPVGPPASSRYSPAPPGTVTLPPASSRYSPAPPTAPAASTRYSPAPPPQAPGHNRYVSEPTSGSPKPPVQPFAPRTSSPLAFHTVSQGQEGAAFGGAEQHTAAHGHHVMHSADGVPRAPLNRTLEEVSEVEEHVPSAAANQAPHTAGPAQVARSETPPLRSSPSSIVGSPRKRSNYTPQYQSGPLPPQSQSPGATVKSPPAPSYMPTSPPSVGMPNASSDVANITPHRRQISHEFQYIAPTDERSTDPLERWKGYPIFKWGLGGTVITSFPKQVPRYGGGASMPMMKCSPGEVKIQNIKETFPISENVAKFPGPLKSKSKKKDVSAWLDQKIEGLESELKDPVLEHSVTPEQLKRLEEKLLLWKIMQILVDHDGHVESNPVAEMAVRKALSPGLDESGEFGASFTTAADLVVGAASTAPSVQAESIDPKAVQELRALLTKGDREKAVWHAVDRRLWAHAMLLSSTLSKDIWKQVVQEFVRKEVKKMGNNNQALAVLYEIFAGNHDECIDELVPASARAGFQMVSTDGNGPTQNVQQSLDKWRETLSLVLNNRSEGDVQALLSLGRLLAGYGRVEAAHVCFIFARSAAHVGGVDDPQSDMVLVGADHRLDPLALGADLEPILLTEVYEFALSLAASNGTHVIPHIQNYKLGHAYALAEYGYKNEAQQYCDAIAAAMKATTRVSPYYNGIFITSLDDLSKRLSQSPKDGSSSWISRPSMDKVSGSLLAKFNSFIAGDDEDVASNHSGNAADVGPFAKIAGNTPTISPSHSNADLYGAYALGGAAAPPAGTSKYAPSNQYAARSSLDQARGRPSMESTDGSVGGRYSSESYRPSPQMTNSYVPSQYSPTMQRPQPAKSQTYGPLKTSGLSPVGSYGGSPYQPAPPAEKASPGFEYQPPQSEQPTQASAGYEPPTSSYEPPTNSWEPPSYEPYQPDTEEADTSPIEEKRKKSFMDDGDDDDDLPARAAALKQQQKSEADRVAEENFKKAAEADAKKSNDGKKGGGWLSGWFKKDASAGPGPIKAKLGEENSFYYDPELKKWVNKKAGAESATPSAPTPPPPRSAPPSRNVSSVSVASAPPMGMLGSSLPNAGMSTPALRPPTSNPIRSSSMPPPMGVPGGPPSRASTPGMPSDSEGAKMAPPLMRPTLPGGSVTSGPPSRPGTGMSTASSIDDLLGPPQARKGGTVKKGKKGGRYVDVMAQK
ncbi:hypothetical protein GQ43DRAFT_426419 [Delitschia confertaspora ATCC 74209]|uniref:Protein transport protein sec16 n=1 Tax=Delitschia confertaspora ATCC 74209 TaxID=1513339 RepID=A0A9P4JC33_9PLEO|nr:hypothetical protein GQ43DRAFT_426419 [Delitschia confertaspora ATCC 74209]